MNNDFYLNLIRFSDKPRFSYDLLEQLYEHVQEQCFLGSIFEFKLNRII